MNNREIAERCLALAKEKYEDAEVFQEVSKALALDFFNTDLDTYEISEEGGMSLRVRVGNRWARAYSEKISEDAIDTLLEAVDQSLEVSEENLDAQMYEPLEDDTKILASDEKQEFPVEKMLASIKTLAQKAVDKAEDVKIANVSISATQHSTLIMNTKGLNKEEEAEFAYVVCYHILDRDGDMKNGLAFRLVEDIETIDMDALVDEAYLRASETYGSKSVKAGKYKVLFENEIFSSLLSNVLFALSAETVQKGMSLLADKAGQEIASSCVNVIDDPMSEHGFAKKSFDDEGVPTQAMYLIKEGRLENFLYNLETAKKAGVTTTANAQRSYKSKSSPGASTVVLEKGTKSFDELLEEVGDGLLITDLQGLHSGLDPISGDFSLPANGFLIKGGKKDRPVNQITVAGNLLDLLKKIETIGSDATTTLRGSYVPSVIVSEMNVSGEDKK